MREGGLLWTENPPLPHRETLVVQEMGFREKLHVKSKSNPAETIFRLPIMFHWVLLDFRLVYDLCDQCDLMSVHSDT